MRNLPISNMQLHLRGIKQRTNKSKAINIEVMGYVTLIVHIILIHFPKVLKLKTLCESDCSVQSICKFNEVSIV